jgi:hypothetical protein
MKVKISYSVDLDEVPDSVINLLKEAARGAYDVAAELEEVVEKAIKNKEYLKILEELDKARKDLFGIDSVLEECYEIVRGYQKTRIQQHTLEHQAMDAKLERYQQPAPQEVDGRTIETAGEE